ncbi:universal stress protein [Streptomyces sp. NPDC047928]|uniref:universal stress protein n=1 Tax=unclassified Streptomyces TaxID=2593676 RepID=UPI0037186895
MAGDVTVGVDGSPESLAAADWGADEAALRGARLRLVHVREWPATPEVPLTYTDVQEHHEEELLRTAAGRARSRHPGLAVATRTPTGRAAAALALEVTGPMGRDEAEEPDGAGGRTAASAPVQAGGPAEAERADEAGGSAEAELSDEARRRDEAKGTELLVLGSRGLGGILGFLIGSVGLSVVAAAERPVVLVRAPEPGGVDVRRTFDTYGEVVLGVDIFHPCEELLAFGFQEAERRACTLRVVHCWSLPAVYGYASVFDPDIGREVEREMAGTLGDLLVPWRQRYPSVRVAERTVNGSAGAELIHAAAGADLVVVGRRRARLPVGPHIGHVTHAVIHHCAAPVAVVPHD